MQEPNEGELIFFYNDVLDNTGMIQPFFWGASENLMVNMFHKSIQVYIVIRIEALFNYLRQQGFKVYQKKRQNKELGFVYKNKNWIVEERNSSSNVTVQLMLTQDSIYRIIYGLYTSEGLKDFIQLSIAFLKAHGMTKNHL